MRDLIAEINGESGANVIPGQRDLLSEMEGGDIVWPSKQKSEGVLDKVGSFISDVYRRGMPEPSELNAPERAVAGSVNPRGEAARIGANILTGIPSSIAGGFLAAPGFATYGLQSLEDSLRKRIDPKFIPSDDADRALTGAGKMLETVGGALNIKPSSNEAAIVEQNINEAIMLLPRMSGRGLGAISEGITTGSLQKASDVAEGKSEGSNILTPIMKIIGEADAIFATGGLGRTVKTRVNAVKNSAFYRGLTIKERGIVTQSLNDIMRNSGMSEAAAVRKFPNLFQEALEKRMSPKGKKSTETTSAPRDLFDEIDLEQKALPAGQGFEVIGDKPRGFDLQKSTTILMGETPRDILAEIESPEKEPWKLSDKDYIPPPKDFREALSITTEPEHLDFIIRDMKTNLEGGTPGGLQGYDAEGSPIYKGSGYPEWFSELTKEYQNVKTSRSGKKESISAKELVNIIDKGLKGDILTPRQQGFWEDINRIADRESTKSYAEHIKAFELVKKGEGYADEITRIANESIGRYSPEEYKGILGNYEAVGRVGLAENGYSPEQIAQAEPLLKIIAAEFQNRHGREVWKTQAPSGGEGKSFTPELAERNAELTKINKAKEDIAEAKRLREAAPDTAEPNSGIKTKADHDKYIEETQQWIDKKQAAEIKAKPEAEDSLIAEARKYPSAEEFVNSNKFVYHGTNQPFEVFDKGLKGQDVKASSAKEGYWFTDSTAEAKDYADYSARRSVPDQVAHEKKVDSLLKEISKAERKGDFDKSEALTTELEQLEATALQSEPSGQRVIEAVIDMKNPLIVDGSKKEYLQDASAIIKKAKKDGYDGMIIENISDAPTLLDRTTQYVVFDKSQVKTKSQLTDIWNKANEGKGGGGTTLYSGLDPTMAVDMLRGLKNNIKEAMPYLEDIGRSVYEGGKKSFLDWQAQMKTHLGDLWESFKSKMKEIWESVKKIITNEKGAIGTDINKGRIVKQRELGSKENRRKAPPVYESELDTIKKMPELRQKPLGGWLENPIRTFEELGANAKELFYRPMKQAEHASKLHAKKIFDKTEVLRKSLPASASKRIGTYAIAQQEGGAAILKEMGIKNIPKLTPEELKTYSWMRRGLEIFYDKIQEARAASGKEKFGHVENYFTFFKQMSIAEKMGFSPIFARGALLNNVMHRKTTAFRFEKHRTGGLTKADLDAFSVFHRYTDSATRHIHLSPVIAKGREMLLNFKTGEEIWRLADEKPRAAKFLTDWLDFVAGQRRPMLPDIIERGLTIINKNLAFSILSANLRSALIQPSAIMQAGVEIGPKWTAAGIKEVLSDVPIQKSNVLLSRQFDINVTESVSGLPGKFGKAKQKLGNWGMKPLQFLDYVTAKATWSGAYKKGISEGMSETAAINYADDVVTKTQASAMPSDLSPAQRSALGKFVTTFQTFVINNWGWVTRDVLGINNPNIPKKTVMRKVIYFIIGSTLVNMFYEDLLGVPSPLPAPIKAFTKALEKGEDIPSASLDAAIEIAQLIPIVGGGLRYGSSMLGAGVEYIGDIGKKVSPNYTGVKRPVGELVGKGLGVPGTAQISKTVKIIKKGGSVTDAALGRYPENQKKLGTLKQPKTLKGL